LYFSEINNAMNRYLLRSIALIIVFIPNFLLAQLTVDFSFSPDYAYSGKTIHFTSQVSGGTNNNYVYDWDFNDGTLHSELQNPTHIFSNITGCGIQPFDVKLTVTDIVQNSTGSITKTIHVKRIHYPPSSVSFEFSANYACSGTPIQFTSHVTGCDSNLYVYNWNFKDGYHSSLKNPTHTFNPYGCDVENYKVILTVSDTTNNTIDSISVNHIVSIKQRPYPQLLDTANAVSFSNCDNNPPPSPSNPNFRINVINQTAQTCIIPNSYSINWGDGDSLTGLSNSSFPIEHIYHTLGSFNLIFKALGTNGCQGSTLFLVKNEAYPLGSIDVMESHVDCAPVDYQFYITNYQNNSQSSSYLWDFGDGTQVMWNFDSILVNNATITHTYHSSSCGLNNHLFPVTMSINNTCGLANIIRTTSIVWAKGKAWIDTANAHGCAGDTIQFHNLSNSGYGPSCSSSTWYKWDFGNGHTYIGEDPPPQLYSKPGTYNLTLVDSSYCGSDTLVFPVRIDSLPDVHVTMDSTSDCLPKNISFSNHSLGGSLEYTWEITPSNGWKYTNGTNSHSPEPKIQFIKFDTTGYTVKLTANNSCLRTDDTTFYIAVKDKPTITLAHPPQGMCTPYSYTPQVDYASNNDSITFYAWSFEGGTPDTSNAQYPGSIRYDSAGVYHIIVNATNECGTRTLIDSINIMVYVPVNITSIDTGVCLNSAHFKLKANPPDGIWHGSIVNSTGWLSPDSIGTFKCLYIRGTGNCESRDSINVTVYPLPTVDAGADRGLCIADNPVNLESGASCSKQPYWDGQGITDHLLGTFNPDSSGVGVFTVSLRCTDTTTTCSNIDYITITVDDFPDAEFLADTFCIGIPKQFDNISSGGYSYLWQFGDGTTSTDTNPYHAYADTGVYAVRLIAYTQWGCTDTTENIVQVTKPPAEPSFTFAYHPTNQCTPDTVSIHFDHSMYDRFVKYRWDFGDGIVTEPSYHSFSDTTHVYYKGIIADTSYHITVDVANLCDTKSQNQTITVRSAPKAQFFTDFHKNCSPMHVRFANTTIGFPDSFTWNFGDNTAPYTTTSRTPIEHIYFYNGNTDTTFCIKLSTGNVCGSDSITDSITVYPNAVTAFISNGDVYGCPPLTVNFSSEGSLGGTIYNWNFGDGNVSNEKNPTHVYTSSGVFKAQLLVTVLDTCSVDTISVKVNVYPKPDLDFITSPEIVCLRDEISFINKSGDLANLQWDFGDSTFSNLSNPSHIYTSPGMYKVSLIGTTPLFDCSDTLSKYVHVKENPIAKIFSDSVGCAPSTILFEGDNNTYHLWNFGDGSPTTSNPEHVFEKEGEYIVKLISQSASGCMDSTTKTITIFPVPATSFSVDYSSANTNTAILPATIQFLNQSSGATEYEWDFGNGEHSTQVNPVVTFAESGNYIIQLTAKNLWGCPAIYTLPLDLYYYHLYMPNALWLSSPKPEDRLFLPKGIGLTSYHIVIYNRWDNKIWESTKINDLGSPEEGWDGTFKGEKVQEGTYYWVIKELLFDNGSTKPNNAFKNTGTIQVIY